MSLDIGAFSSQNMRISGQHSLKKDKTDFFVLSPDKNVCAGKLAEGGSDGGRSSCGLG